MYYSAVAVVVAVKKLKKSKKMSHCIACTYIDRRIRSLVIFNDYFDMAVFSFFKQYISEDFKYVINFDSSTSVQKAYQTIRDRTPSPKATTVVRESIENDDCVVTFVNSACLKHNDVMDCTRIVLFLDECELKKFEHDGTTNKLLSTVLSDKKSTQRKLLVLLEFSTQEEYTKANDEIIHKFIDNHYPKHSTFSFFHCSKKTTDSFGLSEALKKIIYIISSYDNE